MTPINNIQMIDGKKVNKLIIQLGKHLINKTEKINLNHAFKELLDLLSNSSFQKISDYQKNQKVNLYIRELNQINTLLQHTEITELTIEKHYLELYYNIINLYLWLEEKND